MDLKQLREKTIKKTREQVKEKLLQKDRLIINLTRTISTIDKTTNLLFEQLRELYGLHFPELSRLRKNIDQYLEIVVNYGKRENIPEEHELKQKAKESAGVELGEKEMKAIISFAEKIKALREERKKLEKLLEEKVKELTPNACEVAGPLIVAKLITEAGSLKKLAELPSSTIQVMGAEKALFAHLKKGVKPPKHGIIFQHPLIHKAPKKQRGPIARKLASKLSIALKVDYFKGEFIGDKLKKELEEEIKTHKIRKT